MAYAKTYRKTSPGHAFLYSCSRPQVDHRRYPVCRQGSAQEIMQYKGQGADVIAKPFDPIPLSDDIKAIWERYYG